MMEGQIPGGSPKGIDVAEAAMVAQQEKNEKHFSSLNESFNEAEREVNYLRQALTSAEVRLQVLSAAVDRLNAPQAATPSIR